MLNLKGVVKPNRLSEPGLLFFFLICAYPTPSELKPWAWQPSLTTFIYEATRMCYIPHLPAAYFSKCDYAALWMPLLGTLCRPAFARGCCQRNAIEGVCCLSPQLSEMCSITTYSHQVLNSPPSLILHRCSRRKFFFFFFFALNERQEPGTILYKEMHNTALFKSWLWVHFLLFPASPRPKK